MYWITTEYPWLRPPKDASWSTREDHYLVDATLRGISYEQISEHLSNSTWIKRPILSCRQRVAFHTTRAAGGTLLPVAWVLDDRQRGAFLPGVPVKEHMLKNKFQLTNDEYQELALFKYSGRDLYTANYIFRDHVSAAKLRQCLKEMDQLDPRVFKRRVIYFKSRAELRRRLYIQRVEAMAKAKTQEEERAKLRREWSAQRIIAVEHAKEEVEKRAWLPRESYVQRMAAMEKGRKERMGKAESK